VRALLQRVSEGAVTLENGERRAIGRGLVVLLGVAPDDGDKDAEWITDKVLSLRLFPKADAPRSEFDLSVQDVGGDVLLISQFTLFADARKGRRPDFTDAAPPAQAREKYLRFVEGFRKKFPKLVTGEFGAMMRVDIRNEGPVTVPLDSRTP
jgi:D-aminoacyl-tRNA deacylase